MSLTSFAPQVSPQLLPQYHGGGGQRAGGVANLQDWLKAWKSWAATRKRGKMAQFIVQKLEENKQARWLDITIGKFELTEWHNIAEEWFKEKPRSSDQVDAPCMLRKGLPRAFPGLDEVKTESIKEGTQYRSRVFRATPDLVREVQMYVNKPVGSNYLKGAVDHQFFGTQNNKDANVFTQGGFMATPSSIIGTQPQYSPNTPLYPSASPLSTSPLKINVGATDVLSQQNFNHTPNSIHSPGSARIKLEESSPYSVHNSSPYSTSGGPYSNSGGPYSNSGGPYSNSGGYVDIDVDGSPAPSDSTSPYPLSSMPEGNGSMFAREATHSPEVNSQLMTDPQGFNGYGVGADGGAYYGSMLQVPPTSTDSLMGGEWGGAMQSSNSPSYSPESSFQQEATSSLEMVSQPQPVSPSMAAAGQVQPPLQQPQHAPLEVKAYPGSSPLEGGGPLALLFGGQLPRGPKWLSFISQQRPEYIHQVEALEENQMALSTMIPKHDIPETVTLQVVCSGQVVAQTDFIYFATAQYNSDLLFQYLVQNFPGYFPEVEGGMEGGAAGSSSGGGAGYPQPYYDNIPHTSYNLLLGSCRLGIEELVFATLQLPSMTGISTEQLQKAQLLCEEHNHGKLSEVLQIVVDLSGVTSRGDREEEKSLVAMEGVREALARLDVATEAEEGGLNIINRLRQILKMDQRAKLEEEREQQVPTSPVVQPPSPVPEDSEALTPVETDSSPTQQRRLSSSNRLQRQDQSIREDDELTPPPIEMHSRKSIAEKDDQLPPLPLRPLPSNKRGGFRRPFISTHSDAADSAVSMSFDRDGDFELEAARRNSAGMALSGYSSSIDGTAITITIDSEAGYNFANSLHFECMYQVTDDYPPQCDATNVIFKSGDKIMQIGDTLVRDKGPEEFSELLQREAVLGTSVRILPRVSPPPSSSLNSSLGYSSLDTSAGGRSLVRKPSDNQMMDSITMKVSNLLSMKGTGYRRSITLPYLVPEKSFGFKFIGGNAVGLFVTEVNLGKKELQVGDQILELAGQSAVQMSYFEARELMAAAKGKLQLKVTQNTAKYQSIRDQFEFESFYLRSDIDHAPSDTKDMTLTKGSLVRVVNSVLYPDAWLAWSVDETTGIDMELRRIPSPKKAYQQYGKLVYQSVDGPQVPEKPLSPSPSSPPPQNIMVS